MNIPTKPIESTFTDAQWKAIWATGKDVLVSAAAGSGKTKVLITRMIEKVLDKNNPIDVDQLLVVTFTNASAAEMRHRMATALEEAILQDPESVHLRRQLNLLNKAQISTLHSFCLNVVRQYAYLLEVDPGFRLADSTEAALLRDDTIGEVLEKAYSAENPEAMYRLADSFTTDRNDQAIETLIDRLYDYSRVHPSPITWLRSIPSQYEVGQTATIEDLAFIDSLKMTIRHALEEAAALTNEMKRTAEMPEGPEPLVATAEADLLWINEALHRITEETWEKTFDFFSTLKWVKAGTIKKESCDEELAKRAKGIRDSVKKLVNGLKEAYFTRTPARLLDEIRLMAPAMHTLIELVIAFGERYEQVKIDRGIVDFSDLEHYALKILAVEQNGHLVPSDIGNDYRNKFAEVLVDEYQDVNLLQESIIQLVKRGAEHNGNLFMVGDVKQSIYRFRLAEPMLFLGKYMRFLTDEGPQGLKIDLNANFRSRQEVLDATNYIFSQVMGKRVGEIDYDDAAALKYGASYPEKTVTAGLTVLYEEQEDEDSGDEQSGESLKSSQAEARFMVRKIQQLMQSGAEVADAFSGKKRPLEYRDIVILMRSMTWSGEIAEEFKLAGIPVYTELSKGYFEALEVMIMLNTLRIIDNPYQDIPLASVLRAPFIGMTENEMAQVRMANKKKPFFEALKQFVEIGGAGIETTTQQKLQRFFSQLESWRDLARRGSLSELIWQVYSDTHYYEMVGSMSNGKQRQANLLALHDRAIDYEKTSFRGLFRFLRFIDRMTRRGDDLGTARSMSEKEDVVRIMTIHSSKGLEFPYVFIAGAGRKFNKMDFNQSYLFDQHFGLAVKAIDPDNRIMYTSLPFLAMKEKKELEMRAEEMRVLYVAMTRAKEHVEIIGTVKDIEKTVVSWQGAQQVEAGQMLPEYTRSRANSYFDWIGPSVARHPAFEKFGVIAGGRLLHDSSKWQIDAFPISVFSNNEGQTENENEFVVEDLFAMPVDEAILQQVTQRFNADYKYESSIGKRSKQTVSELKRLAMLEQEDAVNETKLPQDEVSTVYLHSRPAFMQTRELSPGEIGTAMHTVMQHISIQQVQTTVHCEKLVEELVQRQLLTVEEGRVINVQKVASFFQSSIAHRLMTATTVMREMPFTYASEDGDGDYQILQGIADCLFQESDGNWVLLDYKSDRIQGLFASEEIANKEMTKRYQIQLNLYKKAIEEIMKITIKEMVLYLFDGERAITIQGDII